MSLPNLFTVNLVQMQKTQIQLTLIVIHKTIFHYQYSLNMK